MLREFTDTGIKEFQDECKSSKVAENLRTAISKPEINKDLIPYVMNVVNALERVCKNPTRENYESFAHASMEMATKTCKIWVSRWRSTFTKQTESKWVSNAGPDGLCGVIMITTLEREPKHDLWTYTTRKVVTSREANDLCKIVDDQPSIHSWRTTAKKLSCEIVEPGAFDQ